MCEQERLEKLAYTDEHEFVCQGKITELKKKYSTISFLVVLSKVENR